MIAKTFIFPVVLGATMLVASAVAAQTAGSALPDGPGKTQIETACTACHDISQVTSQRKTAAEWGDTVDQMIARGAQVSDDDYPVIVKYLGKNFAPAGAAAPAAAAAPAGNSSSS